MSTKCNIPVIDLQDFPNQSSKLIAACEDWGCFRLLNYQQVLPETLMIEMKTVVITLFDLPVEIKRRNIDVIAGGGYVAPSPKIPLYEALGLHDMTSRSGVDGFCAQLDASPHQSRDTIMRYAEAVHGLIVDIGKKLAKSLGVKSENIGFENWTCRARLNKYHFTPQSVGTTGGPMHTDSGFLTILQDDEGVGGLEVMNKSGDFVPVDPWPGTLLVNLGDMATVWSNGRFCNVKHRVQCKDANTRVSIASFLLGPEEILEPLSELVDDDNPRVFVPTTYEDYRKMRFSTKLHAGEALALLHTLSS
ncbi:putative gibberellin 3-beta-dioxygenase [Helianthus annuus]|nr:putative gibberellin 3-beta-dioxygenase [Helianthus annuus]